MIMIVLIGVVDCLQRKTWVDESRYEVKGTDDAAVNAPKKARINAVKQVSKFKRLQNSFLIEKTKFCKLKQTPRFRQTQTRKLAGEFLTENV